MAGEGRNFDLGTAIDETVNPAGSQLDAEAIQQAKAEFDPLPAQTTSPVTAVSPGQAALMPGLSQPINVGQVGGQIIGSQPIFVESGQIAPWGAFMQQQEQRQIAQQGQDELANVAAREEALANKARAKAFKFDKPTVPTVEDPFFQESLNKDANSAIESFKARARQVHGDDWQVALKSDTKVGREFQETMDGLNIVARNANLIIEKFGEVEAGLLSGEVYYTDGVKESFRDYQQMMGKYSDGDVTALVDARQNLARLSGEIELNHYLKDSGILTKVIGEVTGSTGISNIGDFMSLKTSNRVSYDKNIASMILNVRKAIGLDSSYTDDDIQNALEGHFRNTSKSSTSLKTNPKDKGSLKMKDEDIRFQEGGRTVVISTPGANGEGVQTTFDMASTMPVPQKKGGINAEGLKMITSKFGGSEELVDIANVNITSFGVMTWADPNGDTQYKKVATAEIEVDVPEMKYDGWAEGLVPTGKTVKETRTIQIDADAAEDQLRFHYGDKAYDEFNSNESSLKGTVSSSSYNINGESFSKEELIGAGWSEEQLKQL